MKKGTLISTIRNAKKYEYWKSREGQYEAILVRGRRWGQVKIHSVELRRFNSLDRRLLQLDTTFDWSYERIVAEFKRMYPGFTPQDKVTLIWMEVNLVDRVSKDSNQRQSQLGKDYPSEIVDKTLHEAGLGDSASAFGKSP
jgi:hypothetical protein